MRLSPDAGPVVSHPEFGPAGTGGPRYSALKWAQFANEGDPRQFPETANCHSKRVSLLVDNWYENCAIKISTSGSQMMEFTAATMRPSAKRKAGFVAIDNYAVVN
ncbi:hypothetical protein ACXPWS_09670 [Mycobacterium sp. BMJ-28]